RCSSNANGRPAYNRITSNTPSPRRSPSSVAGIVALDASITAPSTDASEALNVGLTAGSLASVCCSSRGGELRPGLHLGKPDDRRGRGGHVLHRGPFPDRVKLVPARKDVRRGQSHLAQQRA